MLLPTTPQGVIVVIGIGSGGGVGTGISVVDKS